VIFAIQDHNNGTAKTVFMTTHNGTHVFSSALLRRLGTVDHNGNTYKYYLARVGENVTDNSKAKFTIEIMKGDTLLAGFEQQDGTILPNDKLKIATANLLGSTQLHMAKTILHYITIAYNNTVMASLFMTSPSQTPAPLWCHPKSTILGYPSPIFPLVSTDALRLTLLTHTFDDDNNIGNDLELQFRLLLYTAGTDTQTDTGTEAILGTIKYKDKKRSEKKFLLNHTFEYNPPKSASYICYTLQFKQIKPTTAIGNESDIVFNAVQLPDLSTIQ
jgi:hypothetical protein